MSGRIIVEALVLVTWWGVRDRVLAPRRPVWLHVPASHAPAGPASTGRRAA
jgi:hypothetical protein